MKNTTNLHFDGICIYMESHVGAAKIGKIILLVMNLICWSVFLLGAIHIPGEEFKSFIIPVIIITLILVFGLGRYAAWNLWGAEYVRINTKSLSFSRSYGLVHPAEKVIEIKLLSVGYEEVRFFDDVEHGKITFYDYDELNNPFEVFETGILISEDNVDKFMVMLENLYQQELMDESPEVPFSLN